MSWVKNPLFLIAGSLLILGYTLENHYSVYEAFTFLFIAGLLGYLALLMLRSFWEVVSSVRKIGLHQVFSTLVFAIFSAGLCIYGPAISVIAFKAILATALLLALAIEFSDQVSKPWLSWVYIWITLLFAFTANDLFNVDLDDIIVASIFIAFLVSITKSMYVPSLHRGRRAFCIVFTLALLVMTQNATANKNFEGPSIRRWQSHDKPSEVFPTRNPSQQYQHTIKPVVYPEEWVEVREIKPAEFERIKHIEEAPQWLVNPTPQLVQPMYAPNYTPDDGEGKNKLVFMLGQDNDGTEYLYAEGPIKVGAYEKFIRAVEKYQGLGHHPTKFVVHTPGGVVQEGLKIGAFIRKNGWSTQVDTVVAAESTGGFIFVSGVTQIIKGDGAVGFHRPFYPMTPDTPEIIDKMRREYRPYWKTMGGTSALYEKMMEMNRDEMFYVDKTNADLYLSNFVVYVDMVPQ